MMMLMMMMMKSAKIVKIIEQENVVTAKHAHLHKHTITPRTHTLTKFLCFFPRVLKFCSHAKRLIFLF